MFLYLIFVFLIQGYIYQETLIWGRNMDRLFPINTLTGDRTYNLVLCPDWELNLQPFGVRDNTPTKPAGQGSACFFNLYNSSAW